MVREDRPAPGAVKPPRRGEAAAKVAVETPRAPGVPERAVDRAQLEDLWDTLNTKPWSVEFFALVRRIEALRHDTPGFGASNRASEDPLRFGQEPSLAFPPCNVSQFQFPKSNAPARLFVNFMGMLGPMGPLPLHLTEYAYQRVHHYKDRTFPRFLDIFNHRLIGLFYRAWAASSMPASFDRAAPIGDACELSELERQRLLTSDRSRYSVYVGASCGLGMEETRHRDAVPDLAKLHFAGRLSAATRGPEGLAALLETYFKVPVKVEEFAGRWVELPPQDRCRLGSGAPSTSLGTLGGGGAVCGAKVWESQGAFRASMGPMSYDEYSRLLPMALPDYRRDFWKGGQGTFARPPGATSAGRLDAWIRNYIGDEFSWDVVLVLKAKEVPRARLGSGTRLGWTSWIMTGPSPDDRGDLAIRSRQ